MEIVKLYEVVTAYSKRELVHVVCANQCGHVYTHALIQTH